MSPPIREQKPMRQGQQNRRGRGRGGRKPQNPLARSYESNGPDVKIRGTAAHIAEKYMSLARDALASGDMVVGGELSPARRALQPHHHGGAARSSAAQPNGQPGEGPNGGGRTAPRWNSETKAIDDDVAERRWRRYPRRLAAAATPRRRRARPRAPCRRPRASPRRTRPGPAWRQWPRGRARGERRRSARSGSPSDETAPTR